MYDGAYPYTPQALLLKWSQFHDGRDFFEFLMDASKQLIGAGWIHILNLLFAMRLEHQFETSGGDECDWQTTLRPENIE
eukprot:Skav232564  [mRNA]  locus=scaffold3309:118307:119170:- [translate_table: standard]